MNDPNNRLPDEKSINRIIKSFTDKKRKYSAIFNVLVYIHKKDIPKKFACVVYAIRDGEVIFADTTPSIPHTIIDHVVYDIEGEILSLVNNYFTDGFGDMIQDICMRTRISGRTPREVLDWTENQKDWLLYMHASISRNEGVLQSRVDKYLNMRNAEKLYAGMVIG